MSPRSDTILVTGATGLQGGAVARALLARGFVVRALVRDPESVAAQKLSRDGMALVRGDLRDADSLRSAMAGVRGVFSVQTFMSESGLGGEVRQGRAVAAAAAATGVEQVVYSSVGGAERGSGVPHFDSKWAIERFLAELRVPTTVLRPTFFMDNFASHGPVFAEQELVVRLALKPETKVQLIAVEDIGAFAAEAFSAPDRFLGQAVEIAGDKLTADEIAAVFGAAAGVPCRFEEVPLTEVADNPYIPYANEISLMFEWFQRAGYRADISGLRRTMPDLLTFDNWLSRIGWRPASA